MMRKHARIWLIVATSLILIGGVIFVGMLAILNWDFTKLSTNKYETNEHEILESFSSISVDTDTADIKFVPSEGASCSVVCYEQKNMKHSVAVKDGVLCIEAVDTRKWYEHIGIHFGTPSVTVYIPQGEYGTLSVKSDTGDVEIPNAFSFETIDITESTGDVTNRASATKAINIKTSTGRIALENLSAGSLALSVSTGNVTASGVTCEGDLTVKVSTGKANLTDVTCKNLCSDGSTGDISLTNVIASEMISVERSTGDIKFTACDAAEIVLETDTGDVIGTLLSPKVFVAKTDTGKVNVPESVSGGRCKITTDTGNIKVEIAGN